MSDRKKPAAFRLDPPRTSAGDEGEAARPAALPAPVEVEEQPDPFAPPPAPEAEARPLPRAAGGGWIGRVFWSALAGLLSLAAGLWVWRLIEDLFRGAAWLGWLGAALAAAFGVALVALLLREARGLIRLGAVADLHRAGAAAHAADDGAAAKRVVARLVALQAADPQTAAARARLQSLAGEIVDGRGLLTLADRTLLEPRDALAKAAIAAAAKRVSVVTAISPRAIVDILFVAAQSVMLTRRIAEIYGARPGALGFLRLGRSILGHLAVTGGLAISDSVLSQLVGHGLAARLSAKLGEGVLNGLLTARVGLAAVSACRPLPFIVVEEPKLQDVAGEILADPLGRRS